jgi:2-polyprenyl-3-methyl-5-hydroxy-6-metoxy-1,4-benzoquinol methylase
MDDTVSRPFYDEYAWAYDLLVTPPLSQQCDFIAAKLSEQGVSPGSRLLDAGCGTGRYALELARRGYQVTALDASPALIREATQRAPSEEVDISFSVGNIFDLPREHGYHAILCRGVLNDLLGAPQRQQAFISFAGALRPSGIIILDVREWEMSVARKSSERVFEKAVETTRGLLTFRSETRLDRQTRQLVMSEQHTLSNEESTSVSSYEFRMQCWTLAELKQVMTNAGFESYELFGAYNVNVAAGSSDRLVCVARLTS